MAMPAAAATAETVASRFLDAVARRDFDRLADTLAEDVWLRALLTRELREAHDAAGAVAAFRTWFGGAVEFRVRDLARESVEGRQRIRWRFELRPEWAPDTRHLIEQVGYCRVRDGRISRLDLVCTGYHPLSGPRPSAEEPAAPSRTTRTS